jgi:hypothetical protein
MIFSACVCVCCRCKGGKGYVSCVTIIPAMYMFKVPKEPICITRRTCGLNTVAEQIQENFPEEKNLVSSTVKVFVKYRSEMHTGF